MHRNRDAMNASAAGPRWAALVRRGLDWLRARPPRSLRLCESLPLGERRFVAVVEFERSRFLVGGTGSSLVLLAQLGARPDGSGEAPAPEETQ